MFEHSRHTSFPGKDETRGVRACWEKRGFGTQGAWASRGKLGFGTCSCCATALVEFLAPLEGFRKPFQDNAMKKT